MSVPVFSSLRGYPRAWVRPDVIAGLTVWAVLVPEALAYASIAGVAPVVGLYAAVPALMLYAMVGSSRHLVVGPMSATAALSAAIVAPVAGADGGRYLALTAGLAICTGIVGLLAGMIRLGFIASFISEPVLKGFIVGLALVIIIGQVPKLLGLHKHEGNFFEQAWGVLSNLGDIDGRTATVGFLSLVLVLAVRRWLPVVPGALLAVVLGVAAVHVFALDDKGVAIVGHIDSGLPTLGLPGLLIGIGVAILLLVYRASRPHVAELAKAGTVWVDKATHSDIPTQPDLLVVRVESGLFFANADTVRDRIEALCTEHTRLVVLDAETSPSLDVTAADMLLGLRKDLASRHIDFRIARSVAQFGAALGSAVEGATPIPVYPTVAEAAADLPGSPSGPAAS
ncbi:hypothetical protein NN3_36000 [Nocardia neocaledoniensis NBRC 108232]|uniref:STAS domain-containing protein n=1 Tax=Nocardia neocaledoniensis TaxID=236511 RepID=A0A317ND11_9NOCA|nr:STAS domain-containing protein [Nocardia neocaledoniensis]GEM32593.1 hypothetical protein NN3_36000 [Nocardia neocaledoniensis NBRC 108232]